VLASRSSSRSPRLCPRRPTAQVRAGMMSRSTELPSQPCVSSDLNHDLVPGFQMCFVTIPLLRPSAADLTGGGGGNPLAAPPPSAAQTAVAKPPPSRSAASGQALSAAGAGRDVLWTRQGCVDSSLQQVRAHGNPGMCGYTCDRHHVVAVKALLDAWGSLAAGRRFAILSSPLAMIYTL